MDKRYEVEHLRENRVLITKQVDAERLNPICVEEGGADIKIRELEAEGYEPRGPLAHAISVRLHQGKLW